MKSLLTIWLTNALIVQGALTRRAGGKIIFSFSLQNSSDVQQQPLTL